MKLTWPNLLSALRIGLVPIFIVVVIERRPGQALLIFAVAGLTDLLDGFFARFLKQQSVLGAYLDPAADKLLLTAAFVMLAIPGLFPGQQIPIWMTVLVISRDVTIVVIALIAHLAIGITKFPPQRRQQVDDGVPDHGGRGGAPDRPRPSLRPAGDVAALDHGRPDPGLGAGIRLPLHLPRRRPGRRAR